MWEIAAAGSKAGLGILKGKALLIGGGVVAAVAGAYALAKKQGDAALDGDPYAVPAADTSADIGGSSDAFAAEEIKRFLDEAVSIQSDEFADLAAANAQLTAEVGNRLGGILEEQSALYETLQASSEQRFSALETGQSGLVSSIKSAVDGLSQGIYNQSSAIGSLADRITGQDNALGSLAERIIGQGNAITNQGNAITGYAKQLDQYGESVGALSKQVDNILKTPSFYYDPKTANQYLPVQIASMSAWATAEQASLAKGEIGTSLNVGDVGLTTVYYPTGHVAFVPSGGSAPAAPTSPAPGNAGAIANALSPASQVAANKSVSNITGKTGTIESQLSGLSASEKLAVLGSAGLTFSGASGAMSSPSVPASSPSPSSGGSSSKSTTSVSYGGGVSQANSGYWA